MMSGEMDKSDGSINSNGGDGSSLLTSESCSSEGDEPQNTNVFQTTAAIKMFSIDMLRETILHYAINDKKGKVSPEMVKEVRLVQKSWLDATNRVIRKSEEAVITLKLDETNSLAEADDVKINGKLLHQFAETFAAPNLLLHSRIPMKLILNLAFFQKENFNSLLDFFTRCGNDLKELEVIFPKDGGTMPVCLPRLTLPLLRKVTFHFSKEIYSNIQMGEDLRTYGDNRNGLWFLQGILNAAKELKSLVFPFIRVFASTVPDGFEFLQLPPTITALDLLVKLRSTHLQLISLNHLPILNHLKIQVHEIPFEEGLMFKILQHFQKTLTSFSVEGLLGTGLVRPHTFLRFPPMEKLKSIEIRSVECKLGPGDLSALPQRLPKLASLYLDCTVEILETGWIENSKFENVKELRVRCASEYFPYSHDEYYISPSAGMMTQIHTSFPNIHYLSLTVNINDMSGISSLLQNMKQLQVLRINLEGNLEDIGTCSDKLDSSLLGLPLQLVCALREHGRVLKSIELQSDVQPSIINLTELNMLSFWTGAQNDAGGETSLISTLLFSQGFMKMPKLRRLNLHPKFKLNPKMDAEWRKQGCVVAYWSI